MASIRIKCRTGQPWRCATASPGARLSAEVTEQLTADTPSTPPEKFHVSSGRKKLDSSQKHDRSSPLLVPAKWFQGCAKKSVFSFFLFVFCFLVFILFYFFALQATAAELLQNVLVQMSQRSFGKLVDIWETLDRQFRSASFAFLLFQAAGLCSETSAAHWFIEETLHILESGWREAIQEGETKTNVLQASKIWKWVPIHAIMTLNHSALCV